MGNLRMTIALQARLFFGHAGFIVEEDLGKVSFES
jgi:hypothetical protein